MALKSLYGQLKQVPTPIGITSKEIVIKTIEFDDPPRIPYSFYYHPTFGDIFDFFFMKWTDKKPNVKNGFYTDEWGVVWQNTRYIWGTAVRYPLSELADLANYKFPKPITNKRLFIIAKVAKLAKRKKKYIVAPNYICMLERMRSLMGVEKLILAPYEQPNELEELLDILTNMTIDLLNKYNNSGLDLFDAFMTWEDWGSQSRLLMSNDMFKKFYKPRYKRIVEAVHENGMHFIWHSCGYIMDLIPDMIDIGVDVVQIDQPRLLGHQQIIDSLGGKMCMWNPVDIQWSTQNHITNDDIKKEIDDMINIYNIKKFKGGFIFRNYPDPQDINISVERQKFINSTFIEMM